MHDPETGLIVAGQPRGPCQNILAVFGEVQRAENLAAVDLFKLWCNLRMDAGPNWTFQVV